MSDRRASSVRLVSAELSRPLPDEAREWRLRALVDELVRQNRSEREITRALRGV